MKISISIASPYTWKKVRDQLSGIPQFSLQLNGAYAATFVYKDHDKFIFSRTAASRSPTGINFGTTKKEFKTSTAVNAFLRSIQLPKLKASDYKQLDDPNLLVVYTFGIYGFEPTSLKKESVAKLVSGTFEDFQRKLISNLKRVKQWSDVKFDDYTIKELRKFYNQHTEQP